MRMLKSLLIMMCAALFVATAARAQNNAALKGDYALAFSGMTTGGGNNWTPFAAVGRFTADGAGNLANGEIDANGFGPMEKAVAQPFTGTYSIGADDRGIMSLNIPGGGTLAFVMMANGNAKFVEIDATGGHGTVGSGTMEKVDTTAYSTAKIAGDYAFGFAGYDQSNNRTAVAGRFTANGAGMFTNGAADVNLSGNFSTWNVFAGSYMVTDGATGRGILNMPPAIGGTPTNLNFAFYVVNAGKVFAMEMDAISPLTPLLSGPVLQQQTPLGGFTNAALNGAMVMYGAGSNTIEGWLLTADGVGTFTLDTLGPGTTGTYSVASDGRVAFRILSDYVAAYVVSPNEVFFIVPDSSVSAGFGEPQTTGPLTNSSVSGTYAGVTTVPGNISVPIFSGEFTADGASPTGNITGTEDIGSPSGASLGVAVNATYSITSSPTNGKGTFQGSIAGSTYVISPSKFVVFTTMNAQPGSYIPCILVFEK